jgi:hypothetical protein
MPDAHARSPASRMNHGGHIGSERDAVTRHGREAPWCVRREKGSLQAESKHSGRASHGLNCKLRLWQPHARCSSSLPCQQNEPRRPYRQRTRCCHSPWKTRPEAAWCRVELSSMASGSIAFAADMAVVVHSARRGASSSIGHAAGSSLHHGSAHVKHARYASTRPAESPSRAGHTVEPLFHAE